MLEALFEFLGYVTENATSSVTWSFVAGFLFGLTCIQCVLPIAIYGAKEKGGKKALLFGILFNLPRMLVFVVLAILAAVSIETIQSLESTSPTLFAATWIITGIVLIIFAAELFGLFNIDRVIGDRLVNMMMPLFRQNFESHSLGAIIRGAMFSIACALESSLILLGIWGMAVLSSDRLFAFLAVMAFGLGNITSTTLAAAFMGSSTSLLENTTKIKVRKYAAYAGSIIILYMGLQYLILGSFRLGIL